MKTMITAVLLILLLGFLGGCQESRASAEEAATAAEALSAKPPQDAAVTTRIIFVDKEHGCECTQKRVDTGWSALQTALAGKPTPTVERLHLDTQPDQVAPYRTLRPMMAVPALYFVSATGGLVELLQGEVTPAQIQTALGRTN